MISISDFITKYNGKYLDTEDSSNLYQCFDLAFAWVDNLGIPRSAIRHLYAYQIFTAPNAETYKYFDIIKNTPTGVPTKGDVLVYGTGVGYAGHVAVFVNGDVMKISSFDQNWPIGTPCHIQAHTYNGILGWLRPKTAPTTPSVPPSTCSDYMKQIKTITYGTNTTANKVEQIKGILKSAGYV